LTLTHSLTSAAAAGDTRQAPPGQEVLFIRLENEKLAAPEIRKFKKRFSSEVTCAAFWGLNM